MADAPFDEEAVDAATIARILQVTPNTVRNRAKAGDLPGFQIGRNWRFFPSVVKAHYSPKPKVDLWAAPERSTRTKRRAA